ncbi:MAG: hypothetical protein L3J35_01470 [Bacteroidales bacterium]|nr:hypothetical protein [Bacteroidales bacterium]
MKILKKILFRIFIIIIFLVISNLIYSYFFLESDIQKHSKIIREIREVQDSCQIVYFGESSNATVSSGDINKSSISKFISEYFPDLKFGTVDRGAVHSGIYKVYLQLLPEKSQVETIIITLNLRSFNAQWIFSELETSLQKSVVLLKKYPPLYNRFRLSFKDYDLKTKDERNKQFKRKWKKDKIDFPYEFPYKNVIEWDKDMFNNGVLNPDGSRNQELTELACHYIKAYAFTIDTLKNPRIKDFDEIVGLAKKRNWNIVFNLLSENTEKANELVGKDLVFLIRKNRDILVSRYTKKGVIVVDNLELVPNEEFIDQNWTTEHYAEKGRRAVAGNVAKKMKVLYSDEFVNVVTGDEKKTNFFIPCEKKDSWGQMQTISTEQFFSGKTSSKTGNGENFSLTFEWGVKNIPDTIKTVNIKCKIFQTVKDGNIKLAIEVRGDSINNIWHTKSISSFVQNINSWENFEYAYSVPKEFFSGDLIKIYIYNPTKNIIYVDDFEINFR